ncbi:MAG TPA: phosphoserine transaminase [Patescibacteria group bacterium]|nr:phosphoserine transaminase [Patescibacteria group bacterium]
MQKPTVKPACPNFSSGPCAKRPGWSVDALKGAPVGRSHRASIGVKKLAEVIDKSKAILNMPADYRLAIVPGSDTGAIEMAMWSMLGPLGVDVLGFEVFGKMWIIDVTKQLKLSDVRTFDVPFGAIPDLSKVDTDRDVVFTWNGTTSGVKIPNGDWIKDDRKGLTFCDATSAVFAMDLPWNKLDVVTWSWQKVLGGEAAHGMLALSPRAVERLNSYSPPWPMPKVFRLTKGGKLVEEPFEGKTINTPSMLAVEDCIDALNWAEGVGGLKGLIGRTNANLKAVEDWVEKTAWAEFLPETKETRSNTSICFKVVDPWLTAKDEEAQRKVIKSVESTLDKEGVAYEIANHRDSPPSFRLWGGATVETSDMKAVLEWISWGYESVKAQEQAKAA